MIKPPGTLRVGRPWSRHYTLAEVMMARCSCSWPDATHITTEWGRCCHRSTHVAFNERFKVRIQKTNLSVTNTTAAPLSFFLHILPELQFLMDCNRPFRINSTFGDIWELFNQTLRHHSSLVLGACRWTEVMKENKGRSWTNKPMTFKWELTHKQKGHFCQTNHHPDERACVCAWEEFNMVGTKQSRSGSLQHTEMIQVQMQSSNVG